MADSRDEEPTREPTWQPVSAVGMMTGVVAERLAYTRQQLALLEQARPSRPGARVLDEETVTETRRVYGKMAADFPDYETLFAEQARRWSELPLGKATRRLVDHYASLVEDHRQALAAILALNEEIAANTIETVMAKSDLELGIEAVARHLSGPGGGTDGPFGSFGGPRR